MAVDQPAAACTNPTGRKVHPMSLPSCRCDALSTQGRHPQHKQSDPTKLRCTAQFPAERSRCIAPSARSAEDSKRGDFVSEPGKQEHDAQQERHNASEQAQSLRHPRDLPSQGGGEDPDESGVGSHGEDGPCYEHAYEGEHGGFGGQRQRRDDDEEGVGLQSVDDAGRERSHPQVPGSFFDLHLVLHELVPVFGHGSAFPYPCHANGDEHESHERGSEVGHERHQSFHSLFEDHEHGSHDQLSHGMAASPEASQRGTRHLRASDRQRCESCEMVWRRQAVQPSRRHAGGSGTHGESCAGGVRLGGQPSFPHRRGRGRGSAGGQDRRGDRHARPCGACPPRSRPPFSSFLRLVRATCLRSHAAHASPSSSAFLSTPPATLLAPAGRAERPGRVRHAVHPATFASVSVGSQGSVPLPPRPGETDPPREGGAGEGRSVGDRRGGAGRGGETGSPLGAGRGGRTRGRSSPDRRWGMDKTVQNMAMAEKVEGRRTRARI
eukprot:scaffold431_cov334-Pavlova_lutheri.AAC.81